MENQYPITNGLDLRENVGAENDSACFTQFADQGADLLHLVGVEAIGRLIQNHHIGAMDDRLSDTDTLLIALGQVGDQPVTAVSQSALTLDRCNSRCDFIPGKMAQFCGVAQIFINRQFWIERRIFREIADMGLRLQG